MDARRDPVRVRTRDLDGRALKHTLLEAQVCEDLLAWEGPRDERHGASRRAAEGGAPSHHAFDHYRLRSTGFRPCVLGALPNHAGQSNCTGGPLGCCYTAVMKRSLQEVVELVVFGLVALLVGTGLLWVVGWVLSLGGLLLKAIAGLLWLLLRFVVPVAIVAGLVYFVVKSLSNRATHEANAPSGGGQGHGTHAHVAPVGGAAPAPSGAAHAAAPSQQAPAPTGTDPAAPSAQESDGRLADAGADGSSLDHDDSNEAQA